MMSMKSIIQGAPTSCRLPVEGHPVPRLPAYKPVGQNVRHPTARNMHALQHTRSADILSAAGRGTSCPASPRIQTHRPKHPPTNSAQHARAPTSKERRHPVGCRSRDILSRIFPHTNPPAKTSANQQRATRTRSNMHALHHARSADILSAAGRGTSCPASPRIQTHRPKHPPSAARNMHAHSAFAPGEAFYCLTYTWYPQCQSLVTSTTSSVTGTALNPPRSMIRKSMPSTVRTSIFSAWSSFTPTSMSPDQK